MMQGWGAQDRAEETPMYNEGEFDRYAGQYIRDRAQGFYKNPQPPTGPTKAPDSMWQNRMTATDSKDLAARNWAAQHFGVQGQIDLPWALLAKLLEHEQQKQQNYTPAPQPSVGQRMVDYISQPSMAQEMNEPMRDAMRELQQVHSGQGTDFTRQMRSLWQQIISALAQRGQAGE